jgi:hypothetical protein
VEGKILYFDKPGKGNTDATLQTARQRAKELGVKQIVVASTHGYTARRAMEVFAGLGTEVIAVTICAGFDDEGWTMTAAERSDLQARGIKVLTCLHALGDDVSEGVGGISPAAIVRETLYRFCQGMKVAVEVAVMAADAGLLDTTRETIAVAGTGEGADTAIVLRPACARRFKELEVCEILAKPRHGG